MELLSRGDAGMIELEAFSAYGDTCLHSTISTLANSHGIFFFRQDKQPHRHRHGGIAYFTRYYLTDDKAKEKAERLLELYRKKRAANDSLA